ncbi:ComEC/Rec2 family competence protein, partial [Kaarinaea lacus]
LSLQLLWPLLSWIAALPQPQWLHHAPTLWALIPAGIGIAWLLAPRGLPARWLGVIWLLPLFLLPKKSIDPGAAEFTLLDVGQGLAAVIQTDSHVLVYDTGPRFPSGFNTGDAVIVPFLRQKGINKVDVLVVSHGDNDHIGGAMSLLEAIPVDRIYSSVVDKFSPGSTDFCNKDIFWEWEEVNFRFIHPMNDYFLNTAPDSGKRNDLSCVLKVDTNASSVLLAGDIEKNVEKKLINGNAENKLELESDIILAPHHGSRTSSTARFILEVKPKYALFAVGYKNRYGFPKSDVVERYLQNNARVLDTAQHGAISFTLHRDADPELTELYRVSAKRYWHSDFSKWYGF